LVPEAARTVLDTRLVEVGDTSVTVATAIGVTVIVVGTIILSRLARRGLARIFAGERATDRGAVGTLGTVVHWAIMLTGFGVGLDTLGIDLAALFAAGAIFAIGIGFAMQNIAQNFVSGVILLSERAIKPGDVIELEGTVCKVLRLGIRATIVQTRDGEDVIVPNSLLVQTPVKNYTLEESAYRLRALVGVLYSSDMQRVREILEVVTKARDGNLPGRSPQVLLLEFGDHAVVWEAAVWMADPWRARVALSELHQAIWDAFQTDEIVIAFPQLDLHLDPPVAEGLARLATAR
jgi:small-conductance mechanosensitive channel